MRKKTITSFQGGGRDARGRRPVTGFHKSDITSAYGEDLSYHSEFISESHVGSLLYKKKILKQVQDDISHSARNNAGSALIITLLLITILTGLVVDFVYEVYIDSSALSNWSNAQRAAFIARSGQTISGEFINTVKDETYTDIGELFLPVEQDLGPDITLSVKIEDENAKFNVNSIVYPNGLINEKALSSLKKLFEYLNINPSLALSIADWIDPDSEPRLLDSEDTAKNSFLWSINELKLVGGMEKDTFIKISPYVTVFGNSLVNINTAELPVLVSLSDNMTELLAKNIIDHRESTPFESIATVSNVSGLEGIGIDMQSRITVKASSFRVTAIATVSEITRIVESILDSSRKVQFWREG
jgi:general secretion pathway protein K